MARAGYVFRSPLRFAPGGMRPKLVITLIVGTIIFGIILTIAGLNPLIALIGGGIVWFMIYFMWSPPEEA